MILKRCHADILGKPPPGCTPFHRLGLDLNPPDPDKQLQLALNGHFLTPWNLRVSVRLSALHLTLHPWFLVWALNCQVVQVMIHDLTRKGGSELVWSLEETSCCMTVSTALIRRVFMNTFCWKYYRDWEEQLPPVSILEEKSIHWMFLWCYLCNYVTLMVSYFDYMADRQTIRHPSLWTSRQFPLSQLSQLSRLCFVRWTILSKSWQPQSQSS